MAPRLAGASKLGEMMTESEPVVSVGAFARWRSSQAAPTAAITAAVTKETRSADLRETGVGVMGAVGGRVVDATGLNQT